MAREIDAVDAGTGSETLDYAEGLIDVYGDGKGGVMLTVRQKPGSIWKMRSVEMGADDARLLAAALVNATGSPGYHQP